jgi:hypothetical protein
VEAVKRVSVDEVSDRHSKGKSSAD